MNETKRLGGAERALRAARRKALRQPDRSKAAAALLPLILLQQDSGQRLRLLRTYAEETGHPLAVYILIDQLRKRKRAWRTIDDALFLLRERSDVPSAADDALRAAFATPTVEDSRLALEGVRERALMRGGRGGYALAVIALKQLIQLEDEPLVERDLCEQLTREEPDAVAFQRLGLASERLGRTKDAADAYRAALQHASRRDDAPLAESLERKLRSLRSE